MAPLPARRRDAQHPQADSHLRGIRRRPYREGDRPGHFAHHPAGDLHDGPLGLLQPWRGLWAPAFAVVAADFDGDGNEDLFLGQNFSQTEINTPRLDAGRGLLLKGDGKGGLHPVPGQRSGVVIYGDQRGAAASDYDGDGRTDLAVAENAGPTILLHNLGAKPGLSVRLVGPAGNPAGVGAVVRIRYAEGLGPAREVHAGSGYWSEDGMVQVLGLRGTPEAVMVRWPGGATTETPIPPGANAIIVKFEAGPAGQRQGRGGER